eukprot:TRINITY_DN3253_c0_g4_i1.p1 TRINITY_DN3253_c0_g4~~TRINITY_DN3253_c0_g4_i1.p1  ORF type:complete len:450 (-),score=118.27 TRINITY_DN3253_c0_g4_i1:52-1401(-)
MADGKGKKKKQSKATASPSVSSTSTPVISQRNSSNGNNKQGSDIKKASNPAIEAELDKLRQEQRKKRKATTLLRKPVTTCIIFSYVIIQYLNQAIVYLKAHKLASGIVSALITAVIVTFWACGPGVPYVSYAEETFYEGLWWISLGILSSVGLGTGLHTFVLYLGPLIAKTTITATECNSVDFLLYGEERFLCPPVDVTQNLPEITFWQILGKIQFDALMWGVGTAIGELPPYFVARAARLSGESLKEDDDDEGGGGMLDAVTAKFKPLMYKILGNLGFFGILLFASVPNPLFDLAGITCGHFLIPFATFFGATLIGKAFIKAHIQTIFVIIVFSKKMLDQLVKTAEYVLPFLDGQLQAIIEKEKAKLHRTTPATTTTTTSTDPASGASGVSEQPKEKGLLNVAWDVFLAAMLLYFLVSIVDSSVQQYIQERDEAELLKLRKKREAKSL